jgi:methylated-DNA-[protein]-cysteine S-methyltransferase
MPARFTNVTSPIGELTLVAEDAALTGVYFPHHWYRPDQATFGTRDDTGFGEVRRQLAGYFAGDREDFDLTLDAHGDEFQRRVWALISRIPYGETTTYGDMARELASELGTEVLAKDVGTAVGRNPLSVIVPCHRVVGKDGKLTGYAGGLARKRFLLELEEPVAARSAKLF